MSRISHLDYDHYSDSDSLNSEEEEQEQLLSRAFGEAAEASTKKKRKASAEDTEAKDLLKKKRKPRPKLTEEMLMGPTGLLKLRRDFARAGPELKCKGKGDEARYVRTLVNKVSDFCFGLFPHMAFENVLERVETLGQTNTVKKFLTEMRNDVRNEHLISVFGRERGEAMIAELEGRSGTTASTTQFTDGGGSDNVTSEVEPVSYSPTSVTNPYGRRRNHHIHPSDPVVTVALQRTNAEDDGSEQENEAVFDDEEDRPSLPSSAEVIAKDDDINPDVKENGHVNDDDDDDDDDDAATKAYSEVAGDCSDNDDESTSLQIEMPATEESSSSEQLVVDDSQVKRIIVGPSLLNDNHTEASVFDEEAARAYEDIQNDEHHDIVVDSSNDQITASACVEANDEPNQSMDY